MSGMRATGRLHLGNYWGALKNWVSMQKEYDCFFGVADWHMLTTGYEESGRLQDNVREMVLVANSAADGAVGPHSVGGSFQTRPDDADLSTIRRVLPSERAADLGFRCARTLPLPLPWDR